MLTAGTCEPDPHLVEFCDRFCMSRTITEPTRVTNCSISLTDLLITGSPERFALSGTMKLGLNDHDLIYTIWKHLLELYQSSLNIEVCRVSKKIAI